MTISVGLVRAEPKLEEAPVLGLSDLVMLPDGVPPLPEPGSGTLVGVVIDSQGASAYRKIFIPEVYDLIRNNDFALDAAKRLRYVWRRDDAWEEKSRLFAQKKIELDTNGVLKQALDLSQGFIFGAGSELKMGWDAEHNALKSEALYPGASQIPSKILLNIDSQWWSRGIIDLDFRMLWFKEGQSNRTTTGHFSRVYPGVVTTDDKTDQLFREKILFLTPDVINRYAWLSFRFKGSDEDMLWVYSPAIKKVRQLAGSLRSDSLIKSAISPDDFLGWSGKPGLFGVSLENLVVSLVAFPSAEFGLGSVGPDGCFSVEGALVGEKSRSAIKWNVDSQRYLTSPGWVPASVVFVPRELWKLELVSDDPYLLYGRQVLYVDVQSQLPVYKIVYDRAGKLWKTIILGWGLAATPDRTQKIPYPAFMTIVDHIEKSQYALDFSKVRYCPGFPADITLADFDPRKLG